MSFEEQCNSLAGSKLEWMKPVADYLKTRNDIRDKLEDDQKSLAKCASYILSEAKKKGNQVGMTDQEVFGMAVHYYDENIDVDDVPMGGAKVAVQPAFNQPAFNDNEEKEKLMAVIKEKDEEIEKLKKKRKKTKKKKENDEIKQMSLFDL